jgi:EmrB/QacA subfamily drug resistance transporter
MIEKTAFNTGEVSNRRWLALVFIIISLLVITLDNTVLNVALPSISRDLNASSSALQWIVDAYVLVLAGCLLTMGYVGDRIGRKPFLLIGLLLFGLFSLGAALSRTTWLLIGMRGLMGVSAAIIMPSTLSILTATFRDSRERAQAIAIWSAAFALGLGIGPLLGGWLLENFNWESIFYLNLPLVFIGFIGTKFWVEDSRATHPRPIDVPGALLSTGGFLTLVYAIVQAGVVGWTKPFVLMIFGGAGLLLVAFIIWELKSKSPMLPLDFFRNRSFSGANLALTLVYFVLFGVFFFLSQFLQTVQGYSPFQAGVRILPIAGATFVFASFSASIAGRIGIRSTSGLGILISGVGLYYFSRLAAVDSDYGLLALGMCIISAGIGLTVSPLTNSIMGSVPLDKAGVGAATNDTNRQIGGALGVAVLGTILNSTYLVHINSFKDLAQLPSPLLEMVRSGVQGAHVAGQLAQNSAASQLIVASANEAFTVGMVDALRIAALVMVLTSLIAFFILPSGIQSPQRQE